MIRKLIAASVVIALGTLFYITDTAERAEANDKIAAQAQFKKEATVAAEKEALAKLEAYHKYQERLHPHRLAKHAQPRGRQTASTD